MCILQIHARSCDRFFEVLPDQVESAELTVENAVSHVLLDLFSEVGIDDVTIRFSSSSRPIRNIGLSKYVPNVLAGSLCRFHAQMST